jgi:hypothetical protein
MISVFVGDVLFSIGKQSYLTTLELFFAEMAINMVANCRNGIGFMEENKIMVGASLEGSLLVNNSYNLVEVNAYQSFENKGDFRTD